MDRLPSCAWCEEPVIEMPTTLHGVPYHWLCVKQRMILAREQVAAARRRRAAREDGSVALRRIR